MVTPTPGGADDEESECLRSQPRVQRTEQEGGAEGSNDGTDEWTARAHHVVRDDLARHPIGIVVVRKNGVASVAPSTVHYLGSEFGLTHHNGEPRDKRPGVSPKGCETRSVALRKLGARLAVGLALAPPGRPGRARLVRDDAVASITNEPAVIMQSPDEVYVFTVTK